MNNSKLTLPRFLGLLTSVVFIWIFFFSVWYSTNILNQDKFVSTTTQVLQSESVRDSISTEIVDRVRVNRPILGTLTAPILTKVVSGIMASDLFSQAYGRAARQLHTQLTAKDPREISIQVRPAKQFVSLLTKEDPKFLENVPDELVLVQKNQIPSLYKFGTALTLIGPILFVVALILLAYLWKLITDKRNYIVALSLCFALSGFIVYCLIPAFGNYLAAQASSINIANILTQVYWAFVTPISIAAKNILILGLVIAALAKFLKRGMFKLPKN